MPRRAMLPYPSTSRRLCAAARCPKVTTIALVSILFACLYNSRTFLPKDQPTLDRVVNTDVPRTVLEPAVEVVKEVVGNPDTAVLSLAQREATDGSQTAYGDDASSTVEDQLLSVGERPADVEPVSVTDLETSDAQKDLVGVIGGAQEDQAERVTAVDGTAESELGTATLDTVASDAVAADAVDRSENPVVVTAVEAISTVEKADEEAVTDVTTTLEGASADTAVDSAERTDTTESAIAIDLVDGEVPAAEKQEDADEASAAADSVTSQSGPAGVEPGVLIVEKQEVADETEITREDIQGVDSEAVIAEKQESNDENVEAESVVDGEVTTTLENPAEKDVNENSVTEEVETTEKQEAETAEVVEGASDTTERVEVDSASKVESEDVTGEETVEDGLAPADKQDDVQSAETDTAETISDSEKQTESAEEAASDTEIVAAEKHEVEADTAVNESEKEKVETEDSAEVADLSGADKMTTEQNVEKASEDVDTIVDGGDEIDAEDRQEQFSDSESGEEKDQSIAETALEDALGTAEKQESEEETSAQEVQGDYGLTDEEK